MPVVYLPHGGGPWPFVDTGIGTKAELDTLAAYLRSIRRLPPARPNAIVVVSAHWEEAQPTVMTNEHPPMLFDYYGFPAESYTLTWPAPGSPAVAARVRQQLDAAGFASGANDARGFDHGAFVPLKLAYPDAEAFDAWLRTAVTDEAWKRDQALTTWTTAPSAHVAHPGAEHLMPLMVVAGAAGADRGTMAYSGTVLGIRISAYHSGALPTVA